MQTKEENREEVPEVNESEENINQDGLDAPIQDPEIEKLQTQQIPIDVLEGLLQMMESDPEQLLGIMEQYPELQEMLQQDIMNMNGGQI